MHTALILAADPDDKPAPGAGVFFNKDWILDNLTAIGAIIGFAIALTMLVRANRSQSGENLVTLGNVALAALTAVAFTALVVAAPALLGTIIPDLKK